MVEQNPEQLDRIFRALGDVTRREMLRRLTTGEMSVGELAEPFDMSLAGASKHIRVLEQAGLVERQVKGRTHRCRLRADALAEAGKWLRYYERFWTRRLDALEKALNRTEESDR